VGDEIMTISAGEEGKKKRCLCVKEREQALNVGVIKPEGRKKV